MHSNPLNIAPSGLMAEKISRDLSKILSDDQISLQWPDRTSYGRDCNSKAILWVKEGEIKYPPDVIVWPKNTAEVAKIAAYAHRQSVPLIPYGGGSGVCGGTWALKGGICLDLKRMDQILEIDPRQLKVQAQTGISGELLERALNGRSLTLGHFPSSIYAATLGGYLACRSAGQYSSLYGKIEDMVEAMEVVLADGEIIQLQSTEQIPEVMDLKEAFLGSEGTLGIMTQATLRVHPQPKKEVFLGFQFDQMPKALSAIREIMQQGLKPAVVRLYDPPDSLLASSYKDKENSGFSLTSYLSLQSALEPILKSIKEYSLKLALQKAGLLNSLTQRMASRCLLILGFHGINSLLDYKINTAKKICRSYRAKDLGEAPGQHWLRHRYSVSYKLSKLFDEGLFADTMEVATTWSNLLNLYHSVREAIAPHALVLAHFSHAYPEGCSIYFTLVGYQETAELSQKRYDQIWHDALTACVKAGGTISHHHGVGVLKGDFMKQEWGDAFTWLKKLKKRLDPHHILNPGKMGL